MVKERLLRIDRSITGWIVATFGSASRPFFGFITTLGDPICILLVTGFVITLGFMQTSTELIAAGVLIPITVVIGAVLKSFFERARPVTEYAMNMKIQTFSFPSGHSSGSMIAYGTLAYIVFTTLPTYWMVVGILLGTLPLLVGISRVYLGAHFPTDVVAGWLLGGMALVIVVLIGPL